jgi:endonuclease YncB( thermonuclease family)
MFVRQNVRVVVVDADRYGRTVGRVYVEPLDVNRELMRQGAAWVYRQHLRDRTLLAVEAEARMARRGLWSLPERDTVPPWAWRRQH